MATPTAVIDIYGMNFEHIPELEPEYDHYILSAVNLSLCAILYDRLKKTGKL